MSLTLKDLDGFPSFDLSVELFGAYWSGNRSERDACIAEGHDSLLLMWDRTVDDLALVRHLHGATEPRVPDWWALTWVAGATNAPRHAVA